MEFPDPERTQQGAAAELAAAFQEHLRGTPPARRDWEAWPDCNRTHFGLAFCDWLVRLTTFVIPASEGRPLGALCPLNSGDLSAVGERLDALIPPSGLRRPPSSLSAPEDRLGHLLVAACAGAIGQTTTFSGHPATYELSVVARRRRGEAWMSPSSVGAAGMTAFMYGALLTGVAGELWEFGTRVVAEAGGSAPPFHEVAEIVVPALCSADGPFDDALAALDELMVSLSGHAVRAPLSELAGIEGDDLQGLSSLVTAQLRSDIAAAQRGAIASVAALVIIDRTFAGRADITEVCRHADITGARLIEALQQAV